MKRLKDHEDKMRCKNLKVDSPSEKYHHFSNYNSRVQLVIEIAFIDEWR